MKLKSCAIILLGLSACALAEVYFEENFDDDSWQERWLTSKHDGKTFGKFEGTAGKFYAEATDKGIKTTQDAHFYALSTRFPEFTNEKKTLVLQFSVKHEQNIDCGGGYIKLLTATLSRLTCTVIRPTLSCLDLTFADLEPRRFMPSSTTRERTTSSTSKDIRCKDDVYTHVYTLIVEPDQTYQVLIDGEKVQSGSLEDDWNFLPPKKIKDPEASKPSDWDDRATIDDPTDSKPEDWDQPEHIPDPDATKPEDWDDEMDGEWEPPQIDNPNFKGEWKPKQIDNPAYKGPWIHPEIDNPEYSADSEIYRYPNVCGVGFDLWQVKSGTIFDNVLVTDSPATAEEVRKRIVDGVEAEKKMKEAQDEEERKKSESEKKAEDDDDSDKDDDEEPEPDHDEL
ncbi:Calreticulin [Orchesella cincta]|uniref:Calreticulin n=1 Tax=Orchesella cincta TaxID=48709 RepID=A0A1D2MNA1_ORCCI|nr:Calreticulin [Orchesella cincta]